MEMNSAYYDFGGMAHTLETIVFNEIVMSFTTLEFLLFACPVIYESLLDRTGPEHLGQAGDIMGY